MDSRSLSPWILDHTVLFFFTIRQEQIEIRNGSKMLPDELSVP